MANDSAVARLHAPAPLGGPLVTPVTTLLAVLSIGAFVVLGVRMFAGLGAVTNINDGYPWGVWIVYDVFNLQGEEQLFVGAVSDKQFLALCQVLARPDLAADPALQTNAQRVALRPQLLLRLAESFKGREIGELSRALEAAGLPYAPIVRPEQLLDDPHLRASGGLVPMQTEEGGTTDVVLLPLTMGGRRPGVRMPLPKVGEHNEEILGTLPHTATGR